MKGPLFGAPNADDDLLLKDCTVDHQVKRYLNPIIVGRWGTGKSAILITRAKELEEILEAQDIFSKRDWYIREQDLQPKSIFGLQRRFAESREMFDNTLQEIWKSEIVRRTVLILSKLAVHYSDKDFVQSSHWKLIKTFAVKGNISESLWASVENVLDVIFPSEERRNAVKGFSEFFTELTSQKLYIAAQRCILDLEEANLVTPVIGIEPLETPASKLDADVSVSQSVIAALLNCFRNNFVRSDIQRIRVIISIPWNRISKEQITLPQHVDPYMEELRWTKDDLRVFICKRIDFEARKRGIRLNVRPGHDEWDAIFSATVENGNYAGRDEKIEKSFDYVCRHTLWRARDIQTIARECVNHFCTKQGNIKATEFFRKRLQVDPETIKEMVAELAERNASLRLEEARRKYKFKFDPYTALYGMKVPFNDAALKGRIAPDAKHTEWATLLQVLWDSGIIGYLVEIKTESALRSFKTRFGDDSLRIRKGQGYLAKGFLFQYNTPSSSRALSIISTFADDNSSYSVHGILHPTFNEYLDLHVEGDGPLGC